MEDEHEGYPYLKQIYDEPDPHEVTKTGSVWTTLRYLMFGF